MRRVVRFLLPIFFLGLGIGTYKYLVKTKPQAERKAREEQGTLVEVASVARTQHAIVVHAQGSVMPAEQIVLQPEVGGRIVWRSDNLAPGAIVRAGEPLVRLDASNYQLALRQQEAQVNRAELDLQLEASRKEIAQREWQLLSNPKGTSEARAPNPLAVRDPQMKTAEVSVDAAKSALDSAKLNVSRTGLVAPFNAFVQRAAADRGQLVSPGSQIATLVGIDRCWVQISVPLENLAYIRVPGLNADEGSAANVFQQVGDQRIERKGRVVRLLGDLDPVGRMARVLVEIEDPFNLHVEGPRGLPLLIGAFVNVQIEGGVLDAVFEVPRVALRDGDRVYLFGKDARLEPRDLRVVWRTPDSVLVREGLTESDRLITSRLGNAIPGMLLRLASAPKATGKLSERQ